METGKKMEKQTKNLSHFLQGSILNQTVKESLFTDSSLLHLWKTFFSCEELPAVLNSCRNAVPFSVINYQISSNFHHLFYLSD